MLSFIDQLGFEVALPYRPQRIVSLVPSQTELLFELGLDKEVVGITKFCTHPALWSKTKSIIGGTKNFHFDLIDQLQPDLILGNKEENYEEGIELLKKKYPVWMSDIVALEDSYSMIQALGQITGTSAKAGELLQKIKTGFSTLIHFNKTTVLYLIWREPWMAAGNETFINSILQSVGLVNRVQENRYPQLNPEILKTLSPDLVFLSSEPYPFRDKHIAEVKQLLPTAKVVLVDGEMFSWYGSRLILAPAYFRQLQAQLKTNTP